MAHSVAAHLNVQITDYDRAIRTFIPGYDTMRAMQLDLLESVLPVANAVSPPLRPGARVLDLGGGTGALAAAVAKRFPTVTVEIWDTDPAMLAVARERCAEFSERVKYIERSFAEPLPICDAVVACIALHHVKDLTEKGKIYANIHRALRSGGIFANADTCMSTIPFIRERSFRDWTTFMATQGIDDAQARRHFADWAKDDYYPPLATEMRLLIEAGFTEPDCFWRNAPFLVFGATK
jgi:tRNA (cmo5U34)-methyltransferase